MVGLADFVGMVRLLNVVNTLANPFCQHVTQRWETLYATLPPDASTYSKRMDLPQMQEKWQDAARVIHQALSASR